MLEVGDLRGSMTNRIIRPSRFKKNPKARAVLFGASPPSPPNSGIFVAHYVVDFTWVNV
jgi:hypothetical protein